MKTKLLLLLFFVTANYISNAQTVPPIQWQKCLGGTLHEDVNGCLQTSDGGFIIIGTTSSTDGDVTGIHGRDDIWIVKLNASGTIEWQKTYGGSSFELNPKISKTPDGGYIFTCTSLSIDGDITGNHGSNDIWVVKITSIGNIQWQKSLGGSSDENAGTIKTTIDGGYIVAGITTSNDGDVTGNHGNWDGWLVKLASNGAVIWTKCCGGSGFDIARDVIETNDGNFVIAGRTFSTDGDLSINYGGSDAWFAKISSLNRTVMWSQTYGGSGNDDIYSLQKTMDPVVSIVASGVTDSPNDYNVTGNHGSRDLWLVTLDDGSGVLTSAKCFGGSALDGIVGSSIQVTNDQGYFINTGSYSTDGDVTGNHGSYDLWMLKLNRSQTIDWQLSAGGSSHEYCSGASGIETTDGSYFICGTTFSNDYVSGNHNTSGYADYWAVKLSPCFLPPVSAATITANSAACGGTVAMSMPGGIAYSYLWYKDFVEIPGATSRTYTATTPGTYTAVVSNGGCLLYTFSPNSIVSAKPVATITPSGKVNKCAADNVNFTANTGTGLIYQWYKGNLAIPGAVNSTYTTKKSGKYKVLVTNTVTQCSKTSSVTTVKNTCKESIASADKSDASTLSAALLQQNIPNPFSNNSLIQYSLPEKFVTAQIIVTDITGRVVKQFTLLSTGKGSITINAGTLAQGVYVYSMYVDGKFIDSKRMVITK